MSTCCSAPLCTVPPLAPPTGSCQHREAKLPTFRLMSVGGVLPTHCVLELSETQSGGRQDLGVEGGRGGRFLMSPLGRVIKVGLFGAELIGS